MDFKAALADYFKAREPFDDAAYEIVDCTEFSWRVSESDDHYHDPGDGWDFGGVFYGNDDIFFADIIGEPVDKGFYTIINAELDDDSKVSLVFDNERNIEGG